MRYKWVKVTVPAGQEVISSLLISTSEEPKTIRRLYFAKQSYFVFRAYVERERILDMHNDVIPTNRPYLDIDIPLPIGQELKVGGYNESAGSVDCYVGVGFEIAA